MFYMLTGKVNEKAALPDRNSPGVYAFELTLFICVALSPLALVATYLWFFGKMGVILFTPGNFQIH